MWENTRWSDFPQVDLYVPSQGVKLHVGTIQAKTFDFHSNMTLHNTNHELIASSNKNLISTIDQTFVFDCQGAQVMTFTENMRRSKHNTVERYEVEDDQVPVLSTPSSRPSKAQLLPKI